MDEVLPELRRANAEGERDMRLIDADKLKTHYAWWDDFDHLRETKKDFDTIIDLQPTVEAEPKHAYVIVDEDGNMECSNCGSGNCFDDYCGHCGAKLIGTRKDDEEEWV